MYSDIKRDLELITKIAENKNNLIDKLRGIKNLENHNVNKVNDNYRL